MSYYQDRYERIAAAIDRHLLESDREWNKACVFNKASANPYLPIHVRNTYRDVAARAESSAEMSYCSAMELKYDVQ